MVVSVCLLAFYRFLGRFNVISPFTNNRHRFTDANKQTNKVINQTNNKRTEPNRTEPNRTEPNQTKPNWGLTAPQTPAAVKLSSYAAKIEISGQITSHLPRENPGYAPGYLYMHLSIYPSTHLSIYPYNHLPIYPSTHLSIYPLSIYLLSIYLFFYALFVQGRCQPTQRQLIQIYSVDWTDVYDTHNIEHRTEPVSH